MPAAFPPLFSVYRRLAPIIAPLRLFDNILLSKLVLAGNKYVIIAVRFKHKVPAVAGPASTDLDLMNTVWKNTRVAALPSALLLAACVLAVPALAQPAADNIQPVGAVCQAGQACVGQPVPGSSSSGQPAAAQSSNNAPAPAADSAPVPAEPTQQSAPADPAPAASAQADTASAGASDFDPAATYNQYCMACHMTGAAGAPKLDDEEAWNTRLEKGMDAVMQNVINGIGAMPARGICNDCSDEQLRAIVDYMVSQ